MKFNKDKDRMYYLLKKIITMTIFTRIKNSSIWVFLSKCLYLIIGFLVWLALTFLSELLWGISTLMEGVDESDKKSTKSTISPEEEKMVKEKSLEKGKSVSYSPNPINQTDIPCWYSRS